MFFGQRSYGVAAAAQVFFGKTISNLSIAEAATLAGVLPAPSNYNPVRSPTLAKIMRDYVLSRMLDLKYINRLEYNEAISTIMVSKLHGNATEVSAPYMHDGRFDSLEEVIDHYNSGWQSSATIDPLIKCTSRGGEFCLLEFPNLESIFIGFK